MELRWPVGCGCRWPDRGTVGRWGAAASRPASSRSPLHATPSPRLPFPLGQLCAPAPCRRWLAQAGCLEPGLEPLPQLGRAPSFVGAERTEPLGGRGTACTMAGGSAPLAHILVALLRPSCCARGGGEWASAEARGGGCTCGGCSASKSGELFLGCLLGCFSCTRLSLPPPTSRTRHPFSWPCRLSLWRSAAASRLGLLLPHSLLSPSTPPLSSAAWAATCSPDRHGARPGPYSSPLCS